ncbi:MAG: amidohydrolase family protein [Chloroflexi bacterium]|nr:amidohydrolase family protein [Chloroflexota bacterium]
MATRTESPSAKVRSHLKHPVIDSDGHFIEVMPVYEEYIRQVGGGDIVQRFRTRPQLQQWRMRPLAERQDMGAPQMQWWVPPTRNTLDRATASLPKLLAERMDELGIDFCVLYPTAGTSVIELEDDELRRVACRAINLYVADLYGPFADRMTPAATIPMYTPQEGIDELEFAVKRGLKASMIQGWVGRPIPKLHRENPGLAGTGHGEDIDTFGPDSPYDYDPFWAKCVELGVPPGAHGGSLGTGWRRSYYNYMYNHVGHFGESGGALCKSLFFSGVTRRFPGLNVAFLEGGVGWACDIYAGLIGRWEKRGRDTIRNMDPALLDKALYMDIMGRYGSKAVLAKVEEIREGLDRYQTPPDNTDDFHRSGANSPEEIRDRFVPNFFFGCEADDPINAWAFNTKANPLGARLGAILSSDIGHWDVPDMNEVVAEAYELVEKDLITEADFRDFVFGNPVRLFTRMNPNFFKGTRVESAVAKEMK